MLSHFVFHVLGHIQVSGIRGEMSISVQASRTRCRKVKKSSRDSGSVQRSQMERERILQGECAAQTKLSEAQSTLDRREWTMPNAGKALYETGMQLQSQRMELHQANQLTDQTRREKSLLLDE